MDFEQLRQQAYEQQPNYKIIDNPAATEPGLAVIYFSSNGTFNPDNTEKRLNEDYYEFHRNPIKRAGRHIYVRDVSLALYMGGINHELDDSDKLLELLKELTTGYHVVTVGVCSGGYMALLAGAVLKARYVLSFSGLIDINIHKSYLQHQKIDSINYSCGKWVTFRDKYINIKKEVAASQVPVFQLESINCEADLENAGMLAELPNVHFFNFDSDRHGGQLNGRCVGKMLNLEETEIVSLQKRFEGKIISQWNINNALLPLSDMAAIYLSKLRKNLFKIKLKKDKKLIIFLGITFLNKGL